ncbi:monofunctional biosynthetic peptidoglycan transglycosylase [Saccharospirillum mangrovi]|uniref:monofunctional biosynthetic peptidoglycan transglycosylase n=1 Tax=Saccharospirillum mangrovi TaxID=2161747 RepID=UPI000D3A01CC|nr:monofunctional biosynthetic peptidoglycan transglycosylase [Saccharospirillum mangrovi]
MSRLSLKSVLRFLSLAALAGLIISLLLTVPLRWLNPPTTAFILLDSNARSADMRAHWTPLSEIAASMPIAVVASEDQRFPTHFGFDFSSIWQALHDNNGPMRGASTISQQLSKNLYLWSGRSLFRKGIEAWFTLLIELTWPKERILEVYLNVVEFGPGVYGVGQASETFFNKPASQLTRFEASVLAAVLPNPKQLSAQRPSTYVYRRAHDIRTAIRYLGGPSYLAGIR